MSGQSIVNILKIIADQDWESLNKQVTGPFMEQLLAIIAESFPNGVLADGKTIQQAITDLEQGGSQGGSNTYDANYFKVIKGFVTLAAKYISLAPRTAVDVSALTVSAIPPQQVAEAAGVYTLSLSQDVNLETLDIRFSNGTIMPTGNRAKVSFDVKCENIANLENYKYGCILYDGSSAFAYYDEETIPSEDYQSVSFEIDGDGPSNYTQFRLVLQSKTGAQVILSNGKVYFDKVTFQYWPIGENAGGLQLPVTNLLLKTAGLVPELPPAGLVPGDEGYDINLHIMPGQFAFNIVDKILFINDDGAIFTINLRDLLPPIGAGDGGKKVIAKADESGYELAPSTTSSGFFDPNVAGANITFDGTTFTLGGTNKFVTANGKEFIKTNDSIVVTPYEGIIHIYYDNNGALQQLNGLNRAQQYDQMLVSLPVAYLLYNSNAITGYTFVGDYIKGRSSNSLWVKNLYDREIATLDGVVVGGFPWGGGNADADAQLLLSSGSLILADRKYNVPTRALTDAWNVGYFNGNNRPVGIQGNPFLMLTDIDLGIGSTGLAVYNNDGNPAAASSGNYLWYFTVITNDFVLADRTLSYMGNEQYANQATAEDNLANEVATIESRLPIRQGASLIYGVLLETKSTFSNAVKTRIVTTLQIAKEGGSGSPTVNIPDELINGSDASLYHNHDSLYISLALLAAANGVATLDANGLVPKEQIRETIFTAAGTGYTLVAAQAGAYVKMTNAAANQFSIPNDSSVNHPIGTTATVEQSGAGATTITPAAGVTINKAFTSFQLRARYSVVKLVKVAANEWTAEGDFVGAGSDITRQRQTLAIAANVLNLDWNNKNELISDNIVSVAANASITYSNNGSSEYSDFAVNITNLATLTFPSGTISPDANFNTLVWTPPENGIFSISITKKGSTYIALFTQFKAD